MMAPTVQKRRDVRGVICSGGAMERRLLMENVHDSSRRVEKPFKLA